MLFVILTMLVAALLGVGQAAPSTSVTLARDDKNPNLTHIVCRPQNFREARKDFTQQNEDYLRPLDNGGPGAYVGAGANGHGCERVACQYASAIYVCNDNDRAVNVHFGTIADYARAVRDDPSDKCNWRAENYEGGVFDVDVTWGQAFDANGWNVIVGMWHSDEKC